MVETGPRRAAAARRLAIVLIAGATAIGLLGLSAGRGALVPGELETRFALADLFAAPKKKPGRPGFRSIEDCTAQSSGLMFDA